MAPVMSFAAGAGKSYEIGMRSGPFVPSLSQGREIGVALKARAARGVIQQRRKIHVLVQFDDIPSRAQRESLSRNGVDLLTYIPNYAWIASIPSENSEHILSMPSVRWIGDLSAENRVDPKIREASPAPWAFDEKSGRVAVLVQLFKDVSLDEGEKLVRQLGGEVVDRAELINTLVVHMQKRAVDSLAKEDIVEWIEQPDPPLEPINAENREIVGANTLQWSYNLDGSGVDVLVYDVGRAYSHPDLDSHMAYGDSAPFDEHSTHVSCTLCGNGSVTPNNRGMAPAANLLSMAFQYDGSGIFLYTNPGDIQNDFGYAKNTWAPSADLLNVSLGTNAAPNGFPCSYEGNYGATCRLLDTIVCGSLGAPFIMAWANGNERASGRCGTGYRTTAPPACAKNPIQSGAVDESGNMSYFSSWGPTEDGRVKPVICAPGVNVLSCNSSNGYTTKNGTSMASPTTAGIIALMLQQYRNSYSTSGEFLPSTAKALLIHSATDKGNTGPDYQFGYGVINGIAAVDAIIGGDFREDSLSEQGQMHEYTINVASPIPELKVSMAWDDPAGSLASIKKLVNDLDLSLIGPDGTVFYPWILDPDNPANAATTGIDSLNNQEQVAVNNPTPGTWKIHVSAALLPSPPQSYSIVFPGAHSLMPESIPGATPTSTPTPARCEEAIGNGGFESGASPWNWSGSAAGDTSYKHSGTYSARAGGVSGGYFYQEIPIPAGATGATLVYWVMMQTSETGGFYDFFDVEIQDTDGTTLTTLQSLCNGDSSYQNTWVEQTFSLGAEYAGMTLRVQFQAVVDGSIATYFYIDDVSLNVCGAEPTSTPTENPTETPTCTPTSTATETPTQSPTQTPTETPTMSPPSIATETPTNTPTRTPTNTPTKTPTSTPTHTPTGIPTPTATASPSVVFIPTTTPTQAPSCTPTPPPPLIGIFSSGTVTAGDSLTFDLAVQPMDTLVDIYGGIMSPQGVFLFSFYPPNPHQLRNGIIPLAKKALFHESIRRTLYINPHIPPGTNGTYTFIVGFVPAGKKPAISDVVPGYLWQGALAVR